MERPDDRNAALYLAAVLAHRLGAHPGEFRAAAEVCEASGLVAPPGGAGSAAGLRLGWLATDGDGALALTDAGKAAAGPAILWPSLARKAGRTLKGPTSIAFDKGAWRALLAEGNAYSGDEKLVASAEWLAAEAEALRPDIAVSLEAMGGTAQPTLLAVAFTNRDHMNALAKTETRAGVRVVMRNLLNQPVALDDYNDAACDTLELWLVAISRSDRPPAPWPASLPEVAARAAVLLSGQRSLHGFAQKAIWEHSGVTLSADGPAWTPDDADFDRLAFAWNALTRSSPQATTPRAIEEWVSASRARRRQLDLPLTVVGTSRAAGGLRIDVGPPPLGRRVPLFAIWTRVLEASYLADHLDAALPARPELNCRLLLRARCVLEALAVHVTDGLKGRSLRGEAEVRMWAVALPRRKIEKVLSRALGREASHTAIVDFPDLAPRRLQGALGQTARDGSGRENALSRSAPPVAKLHRSHRRDLVTGRRPRGRAVQCRTGPPLRGEGA